MSSGAKRLVQSLRGRSGGRSAGGGRSGAGAGEDCGVGGGGASTSATRLYYDSGHELDEISVIGAAVRGNEGLTTPTTPCHYRNIKYGSGQTICSIAGLPAPAAPTHKTQTGVTSSGGGGVRHRLSGGSISALSCGGEKYRDGRSGRSGAGSGREKEDDTKSAENVSRGVLPSRQSLLDLVSGKFMGRHTPTHHYYHQQQQQRYFSSSRDSLQGAYVNRGASELDLSRKPRRRDHLRGKFKLPYTVALTPSRDQSHLHTPASVNHLSSCNSTETRYTVQEQQQQRGSRGYAGHSGSKRTIIFDPAGRLYYYWSMVVSIAFLYNFWVIIYRFAFQEINGETCMVWFLLDYFSDTLYVLDILFHVRMGYLEDGVLQTDTTKMREHYMNSTRFYVDVLSLLPLDFLYISIGFNSMLRSFRLVKIYRFWAFMDRTERHTNYPNLFRAISLIHNLLMIFHWNGCVYHIVYKNNGFGSKNWVFSDSETADVVKQYLQSYYWCTLALTTIGDLPRPRTKGEYLFVIGQLFFGLLLFAAVLGHVANIVTSISSARKEFQAKLDGVKTYMRMRRVPNHLQVKVIKWFDYLWLTQKCSDEEKAVSCLPDKLKAEIAINVHLDTLRRVEIFQNTEAGFLCELVLRLRPVLFSPGDYICRKGEVGKEMYIVNRGRLQVVADNGKTVLATLKAGSYFGEISILNMGTAGNRRTASVRSVGYSDLFVLSKKDMWDVLKEYPAARVRLEAIAVKRLEKYKRAPLEKAAMPRCQSTPGLVESRGRVPLEEMWISPIDLKATHAYSTAASLFSPSPSPVTARRTVPTTGITGDASVPRGTESPTSAASSGPSSEEQTARVPHAAATQPSTRRQSTGNTTYNSTTQLMSEGATPLHDALLAEIQRLRERLKCLESENAAMSVKLSQQQWEVEHRLAEIEMQICGGSSTSSVEDNNERNRERYGVDDQEEPDEAKVFSDTKSIGSLSQHFFDSDGEDERYYGTCNGYVSRPGSKSNLLLCSECDQKTRTCTYQPQTPSSYPGRYVEERIEDRLQEPGTSRAYRSPTKLSSPRSYRSDQERVAQTSPRSYRDPEQPVSVTSPRYHPTQEQRGRIARDAEDDRGDVERDRDESPICELCRGNGYVVVHCEHCDFSSDGDLICFRCQSDEGSSNGQTCPRCEREAGIVTKAAGKSGTATVATTSSSDEGNHKYPVDAVVKIQVNDRSIDVDSDETAESESSGNYHPQRGAIERLDTIVEIKGDTASENDEENGGGTKLNGTTSARYLNYMIVLFL
ncbi:potassium/sodium hyperpolarization-activated cyclic nucleotide-gated channel 1-like [Pseudomyrmex gracilis]|uniref:potassium/sodium hyperpolarization-activated cyclic nucleotide-gated channel 1-like n=1 Tax=Pseudomyrmex gracilis TaxID=219809 RepID=UPI000994E85F|nr:potassium/sodium hyperpolarization-activated cyclic nucleotide-gated channel 1-like [Pseudomyrmex gracilis]